MYHRLRKLREERALSQRDLAELHHVSQVTYSRYERGTQMLTTRAACILAVFYNVSIDYLVGRTDDPTPYWK